MESIGQVIKTRRNERGLTLTEAHESTKITMQNLAAIEEDRFDAFPNRVYARAFLRDYTNFLGLDSTELLQRYEQEWGSPIPEPIRGTKSNSLGIVFGAVALIAIVTLAAVYYLTHAPRPPRAVKPTEPMATRPALKPHPKPTTAKPLPVNTGEPIAPVMPGVPAKPGVTVKPGVPIKPGTPIKPVKPGTPVVPGHGVKPPIPATNPNKVTLTLKTLKSPAWVSIKVDNDKTIQQMLQPGQTVTVVGSKKVFLITGNAGGLDVTYNGRHLPPLGQPGRVVRKLFANKQLPPVQH